MENKKILKKKETWKKGVHSMKESSEKAIEVIISSGKFLMSNKMTKKHLKLQ